MNDSLIAAPRFRQTPTVPSLPGEWFYDGKAVRTDAIGFRATTTQGTGGTTYTTQSLSPPLMQWKTNRLLLGVAASIELAIGAASANEIITASAFLGYGESNTIDLVGPSNVLNVDGGVPNILCGSFCSLSLVTGQGGAKSKNFGLGFGRTPLYLAAGRPVKWFVIYTVPTAPTTGSFVGNANFFTVEAK